MKLRVKRRLKLKTTSKEAGKTVLGDPRTHYRIANRRTKEEVGVVTAISKDHGHHVYVPAAGKLGKAKVTKGDVREVLRKLAIDHPIAQHLYGKRVNGAMSGAALFSDITAPLAGRPFAIPKQDRTMRKYGYNQKFKLPTIKRIAIIRRTNKVKGRDLPIPASAPIDDLPIPSSPRKKK